MVNPVPNASGGTAYGVRCCQGGRPHYWAGHVHKGRDFAAPNGTPVYAPWSGVVTGNNWGPAFGTQIVIDFDKLPDGSAGLWGLLAHLSRRDVGAGTRVTAGQLIGRVGATGNVTGPHLHFEVRNSAHYNGSHYDPAKWVNASGGAGTPPGGGNQWDSGPVYRSKLRFGQRDSDSVRRLQRRLNGIPLRGGRELPITGNFLEQTDHEVRLWQEQVCNDVPDAAGASFLGPRQTARMFPVPPFTIHD
jgi:hypothetical protein